LHPFFTTIDTQYSSKAMNSNSVPLNHTAQWTICRLSWGTFPLLSNW